MSRVACAGLLVCLVAMPAGADPESGGEDPTATPAAPAAPVAAKPKPVAGGRYSHKGQVEVSLRLALGLRAIATYNGDVFCGDTDRSTSSGNAPVCTSRTPMTLDAEVGYGISPKVDLFAEFRLGIEQDFGALASSDTGPRLVAISPGARLFFGEGSRTKLFTTGQLVFDLTGYEDAAGVSRGNDFGIRNLNGLWIDFAREYGVYAFVGETATFARWLDIQLEVGIGIQGRYP